MDFPHIRPVLIEPHIPHEQNFAPVDEAGERAVDFFAPGSHAGPVAKEALGRVVPLQHVPVSALEFPDHPVVQLRRNNHAIARSVGQLRALCGDAFWHAAPGAIVANCCLVGRRLELSETLHVDRLVVTYRRAACSIRHKSMGDVRHHTGGITSRDGMTPTTVRLADCSIRRPRESHTLLTSECDDGVQRRSASFEPTIGQDARRAAVDFSANWLKPGPDFVSLAPPHRLPDDHVPVVALVADQRVVGDAVVHDPAEGRVDRDRTRNRFTFGKNLWTPRAICLAVSVSPPQ